MNAVNLTGHGRKLPAEARRDLRRSHETRINFLHADKLTVVLLSDEVDTDNARAAITSKSMNSFATDFT